MAQTWQSTSTTTAPSLPSSYRSTRITLENGRWYAGAIDTGIVPASLALDTIEDRLRTSLALGSLRLYTSIDDVPSDVPQRVRAADGADVWATGQYLGAGGTYDLPDQVLAVEEFHPPGTRPPGPTPGGGMTPPIAPFPEREQPGLPPAGRPPGGGTPAPGGDRPTPGTTGGTETSSTGRLVAVAIGAVVVVGGAIALYMYSARPKRNPRRRRRRR